MKAFVAAVICAVAIGVGASYVLHTKQETVDVAFSTSGARVGDELELSASLGLGMARTLVFRPQSASQTLKLRSENVDRRRLAGPARRPDSALCHFPMAK
jgi:hypothetical protein